MVEKVEVVVQVRSRRLTDVDWIVVELWMKKPLRGAEAERTCRTGRR